MVKRIVIFAPGSGSNAANIIQHFEPNDQVKVVGICCNNSNAGVLNVAARNGVASHVFNKSELETTDVVDEILIKASPDLIVLAGFLLKFPNRLVHRYDGQVINLHPSLLPKFGGKGMYGAHVHKAVLEAGELESGITVHFVNDEYDDGAIIAQFSCELVDEETPASLQLKIKALEEMHFPTTVEKVLFKEFAH